jgi:hypothetical protein
MENKVHGQAQVDPHALKQQHALRKHSNKNLERSAEKTADQQPAVQNKSDSVSISYRQEVPMTYESSLTIQTGTDDIPDQFSLLRGLVTSMLKEQGIDFKVANGDQEIDISELTQEEAVELIAEDGYFGVEQTSDRIVDLAIAAAGGDTSKLDAIKEGVEKGFNEALQAFNGWLPDISYDTYDAVMEKLDAWAEVDAPGESLE